MNRAVQPASGERSVPGIRGRLISSSYAGDGVQNLDGAEAAPPAVRRAIEDWWRRCEASLGPASSVRAVADVGVVPLLRLLGFSITRRRDEELRCVLQLAGGTATVIAVTVPWGASLSGVRLWATAEAIASDAQWCLCSNGRSLRIVDGRRTWSRQYLEFEAPVLAHEPTTQSLLC